MNYLDQPPPVRELANEAKEADRRATGAGASCGAVFRAGPWAEALGERASTYKQHAAAGPASSWNDRLNASARQIELQ